MPAFRNIFKSIPIRKPKRNIFDLSFDNLLTCNFGELVPVLCKEVLPGDTWQVQSATMIRFAPMIAPIMHRVNVYIHYFFVPNRLLWSDFEDFITGGKDGTFTANVPSVELPVWGDMTSDNFEKCFGERSLWDYLGLPTRPHNDLQDLADDLEAFKAKGQISALPFLAYNKIYSDYYRDENLEDEIDVKEIADSPGGLDPTTAEGFALMQKRNRAWEKDYFSSALPWPQRGGDVHLPLQGDAEVKYTGLNDLGESQRLVNPSTGAALEPTSTQKYVGVRPEDAQGNRLVIGNNSMENYQFGDLDPNGTLKADLSEVTSTTVNELRRAMRLQEWLEKNARSGARYIEQILAHFGVRSSDARLDRAEYLGGGKCPVQIGSVFQTSATSQDGPLADMAGRGVATGSSNKFKKFFEEHGYVMGIMSIVPRSSYGNGIPKHFTKNDKFDFAWPEFANLGEQEIKGYELNLTGDSRDFDTFGYTPRYADYKFSLNEFHGDFRSSLAYWHLGRMFDPDTVTNLNEDFVHVDQSRDNLNRIFAVQDPGYAHIWCEVYNQITVARTLPKFGVPTL